MTHTSTYIAYYRVSTQKQGQSGLGLDAQRHAVASFVKDATILAEFVEIESGKKNDRPALVRAIEEAKRTKSILVIAKLDRLSRNAAFIFKLRDSGVEFVCADMPDANTLTIGIFAVLAQHERELISQRTKAALAAKKAQGFTLGRNNLTMAGRVAGAETNRQRSQANENNRRARMVIATLLAQKLSYHTIAKTLNAHGFKSARGNVFRYSTVRYLAERMVVS